MSSYDEYLQGYVTNSQLRRRFVSFVESGFELLPPDASDELSSDLRNYKSIAALGFLKLDSRPEMKAAFEDGTKWIIGRDIEKDEALIYDDIAIMGLFTGIKQLSISKELGEDLLVHIKKREEGGKEFVELVSFWHYWFREQDQNYHQIGANLKLLLKRYLQKINNPPVNFVQTYLSIKRRTFPYTDEEDVFMNIVMFSNVEFIEKTCILNQSDFAKEIAEKRREVVKPILAVLVKKAKTYSRIVLLSMATIAAIVYAGTAYFVLSGDWDYYEPRTFVLFGTPAITYVILILYYVVTEKELTLNPRKMALYLQKRRRERLIRKFKVQE